MDDVPALKIVHLPPETDWISVEDEDGNFGEAYEVAVFGAEVVIDGQVHFVMAQAAVETINDPSAVEFIQRALEFHLRQKVAGNAWY